MEPKRMADEEMEQKIREFTQDGDLYGLYLMTMQEYELDVLLHAVEEAKKITPETTQIWVKAGDTETRHSRK